MTEQPQRGSVPDWTLGWRLQRALAHAGISVNEIAQDMGVSRATISRWINDRGAAPRQLYVREWALRTGVDYGWLSHGGQDTPPGKGIPAGQDHVRYLGTRRAGFLSPVRIAA